MSNVKKQQKMAIKIKKARREAGLSQKALGAAAGLSDKAISTYEVGRAMPTVDTLKEISRVTYKPVAYFLDDSEPDDGDIREKVRTIERELAEIKKLLSELNSKK